MLSSDDGSKYSKQEIIRIPVNGEVLVPNEIKRKYNEMQTSSEKL